MLNDMKVQFEDQMKKGVEANTKVRELSADFTKVAVERNNDLLNKLIQTTMESTQSMAQSASPSQLWEQQVELTSKIRESVEGYVKSSSESVQEYSKTVSELTGELFKK
jgi:hypothetical protein